MDVEGEFERMIELMQWKDIMATACQVVDDMLKDSPRPLPPPPHPHPHPPSSYPTVPPEPCVQTHPQTVTRGYDLYLVQEPPYFECEQPLMAAPQMNVPQTAPVTQATQDNVLNMHCQGQTYDVPAVNLHQTTLQNLAPFGTMNGDMLYLIPDDSSTAGSAAPPLSLLRPPKRRHMVQEDDGGKYIKKPPNAFMVFRREQRPYVVAELSVRNSAVINTELGRRWKLMSQEEKDVYYAKAAKERQIHAQQFPFWTSRDNYGKKRKRDRRKVYTSFEESPTQQAHEFYAGPNEPPVPHSRESLALTTQSGLNVYAPATPTMEMMLLYPDAPAEAASPSYDPTMLNNVFMGKPASSSEHGAHPRCSTVMQAQETTTMEQLVPHLSHNPPFVYANL